MGQPLSSLGRLSDLAEVCAYMERSMKHVFLASYFLCVYVCAGTTSGSGPHSLSWKDLYERCGASLCEALAIRGERIVATG